MIDYQPLYNLLVERNAEYWSATLPVQIQQKLNPDAHGNFTKWNAAVEQLPLPKNPSIQLDDKGFKIGLPNELSTQELQQLDTGLKNLFPWRKGPYNLFGLHLDTEWRSDWKWERIQDHISPLDKRLVLDVGCGNGYHCWRSLGAGAQMVVGIDPVQLHVLQFQAIRRLFGEAPVYVLPLTLEEIPAKTRIFDTVFSMGVLYHRRSPIDHLTDLRDCLRSGGELVLETLVVEGKQGEVLVPEGRYARMRNVWFLPTCDTLVSWMKRCGFKNIRVIDVNQTSMQEQRATPWMTFNSLEDFLDPDDPDLTIEGHPAPRRATFIATID
ncbi:MAG: tRNA 5-methoxyuridine(34)/uridine 5-oxyacetic acid(34) synthase CmoB [Gammaproteobacteria bacterium]|jgi:tRNA (mo5U34)-methyltransferase|nr:tRNA 5-methoxyuridine(34)/uridine 5-oxyacetic acid(34) synthase CmoB [Gammaproteobacteria bacterium]MBT5223474.1 tRNA 5-methoxyuridine(34)/uridine 5-oxyacetic acid(34) synthase CmoB [Gammaproteobacteria bacterium]MBT5825866.1 tRNA 5-methoxyuridine(34)/uridine 5-oxyacetic acid(34) synthase CmoB [Gammaproteobacteria bacterium]MBT5965859.1 tRNA 5-methoxyuridine(34)/uridine 5-oxyacetic acid(34) synthase CmoB [Gammaproteobacteria bacterium]MBT6421303.1 tRNA 5-methoxyuridine(34)/uridine 5-oxyaceti